MKAKAALQQAENDYKRDLRLIDRKAISQAQMDQSTANVEVNRAKLNAAAEAVKEAEVMLSYARITAPKSGVIVDRLAEPGDMARPGVPLLVLYDPTTLRLDVPVMEGLKRHINLGDKFDVHIDVLGRDIEGTVDEIVPESQAASRSFLVKVALPKTPELYEGVFGRLKIPTEIRRHLCIPEAAVERIGQLRFVDVVGIMPGFWLLNVLVDRPVGGYPTPVFFTATAMIGMIALAGIVVRNSIVLIDFIRHGKDSGLELREAVIQSVAIRTRPIVLTAGTALLGNWVITLDPIFSGLAWAIIFGIFTSTVFSLLVVPVVYWLLFSSGSADKNTN